MPSDGDEPPSGMEVSLADVDDGLSTLTFDVDVVDDRLTTTAVPTLDITVENTGGEPVSWRQAASVSDSTSEFSFPARTATPDRLAIGLEQEVTERLVDDDGCARVQEGIERTNVPTETQLDAGDVIEQRYAIVGNDSKLDSSCPPADVYRTEWEYEGLGRWGFEVELETRES